MTGVVAIPPRGPSDVTVNVEPTPVTIANAVDVQYPKAARELTTVQRDREGNITTARTVTEFE
jgi:hypothetical protein